MHHRLLSRIGVVLVAIALAVGGFIASPVARAEDPAVHRGDKVLFPGNDGQPHEVTWDKNSFKIDGERLQIWSGELHHWRVPSEDGWRDVFQKLRASGFNAVSLYFFWGMHQSVEGGPFDFSAPHDIDKLLTMAAEEGLYVIARPGPYVNAEISMGGLPGYMVNKSANSLRSNDPSVLEPSKAWLSACNEIAKNHQVTDGGGSVLLYQIENELLSDVQWRKDFLRELTTHVKDDGITVPVFHNEWGMGGRFADVDTYGIDFYAYDRYPLGFNCSAQRTQIPESEAAFRAITTDSPIFVTEAQGGAFTPWGASFTLELCAEFTDSSFTRQWGVGNFGNGVTAFNYYMIIGGTNWGYSGAPASGFTSYDYGAALNEDRTITAKLAAQQELGYFQDAFPELLTMDPVEAPAVDELTGAEVRTYQRQAIEGRDDSVTGNGARYIGARLANSNLDTDTSFTIPLVLDEGTVGAAPLFTTDDRDPAITWAGSWEQVEDASAFEGTLTRSSTAGATLTHTFVGTGLEIIAPTGTDFGKAIISIDGGAAQEFTSWWQTDQNAPTQHVVHTVTGLAPGQHTVTITVTGEVSHRRAPVDSLEAALMSVVLNHSRQDAILALECVLNKKLLDRASLEVLMQDAPAYKRHLLGISSALVESPFESLLKFRLWQHRIKARPQVQVPGVGRVDFLIGQRLIIEVDSEEHHTDLAAFRKDRERDRKATERGYKVLRFTTWEIQHNWPKVLETILRFVQKDRHRLVTSA